MTEWCNEGLSAWPSTSNGHWWYGFNESNTVKYLASSAAMFETDVGYWYLSLLT